LLVLFVVVFVVVLLCSVAVALLSSSSRLYAWQWFCVKLWLVSHCCENLSMILMRLQTIRLVLNVCWTLLLILFLLSQHT